MFAVRVSERDCGPARGELAGSTGCLCRCVWPPTVAVCAGWRSGRGQKEVTGPERAVPFQFGRGKAEAGGRLINDSDGIAHFLNARPPGRRLCSGSPRLSSPLDSQAADPSRAANLKLTNLQPDERNQLGQSGGRLAFTLLAGLLRALQPMLFIDSQNGAASWSCSSARIPLPLQPLQPLQPLAANLLPIHTHSHSNRQPDWTPYMLVSRRAASRAYLTLAASSAHLFSRFPSGRSAANLIGLPRDRRARSRG